MAQQYKVQNYITGQEEYFNTIDLATTRITEIETQVMIDQASRFNIIQIIDSAKGTMWVVPSDNSQEDGTYMVFNSNFGTHENIVGRTAAFARNQELKDAFLAELTQTPTLVDIVQPISKGTQTL
jgi:hypothetical protein